MFAIKDNPGISIHLHDLVRLTEFSAITSHAMGVIRSYFDLAMFEPFSPMSMSLYIGDDIRKLSWCTDLDASLALCQKAVLDISYRRPKRLLYKCFNTVRNGLTPIVNPSLRVTMAATSLDLYSIESIISSSNSSSSSSSTGIELASDTSVAAFISDSQLRAVDSILVRIIPYGCADVLKEFIPWLVYFGVSPSVVEYTLSLNLPTSAGDALSDEKLRKRLLFLRRHQPHAYNVIQVATRIIHDSQRIKSLGSLPSYYYANQINAIQGRFGIIGSNCILDSMIYFVYCKVCGAIYSLLRDFHTVYKQNYSYGYRDAVVDYDTDEIYCNRSGSNHIGKCAEEPLTHVFLLGQVIQYQNKTILLCPQVGCGMPMVLDSAYCLFNERGVACCDCTRSLHAERYNKREVDLMDKFVADTNVSVTCAMCSVSLLLPSQMYWYPFNIILCKNHSSVSSVRRYNDEMMMKFADGNYTRDDVIRVLDKIEMTTITTRHITKGGKVYRSSRAKGNRSYV
jgi:hypothetical protein